MSEKYIRQNKTSYSIVKNSRTLAKITNLEDAIFIRDLLIDSNWDLKINQSLDEFDKDGSDFNSKEDYVEDEEETLDEDEELDDLDEEDEDDDREDEDQDE